MAKQYTADQTVTDVYIDPGLHCLQAPSANMLHRLSGSYNASIKHTPFQENVLINQRFAFATNITHIYADYSI